MSCKQIIPKFQFWWFKKRSYVQWCHPKKIFWIFRQNDRNGGCFLAGSPRVEVIRLETFTTRIFFFNPFSGQNKAVQWSSGERPDGSFSIYIYIHLYIISISYIYHIYIIYISPEIYIEKYMHWHLRRSIHFLFLFGMWSMKFKIKHRGIYLDSFSLQIDKFLLYLKRKYCTKSNNARICWWTNFFVDASPNASSKVVFWVVA